MNDITLETAELPLIGDKAPDFSADTTHGPVQLADYAGRWLVLFSHPADFTPVCTTEFVAFAELAGEFTDQNVALLGTSIDSVHSHLAWTRSIQDKLGVAIPFPIIADLETRISRAYGMLHPSASQTAAVRAVFVIDPQATVLALPAVLDHLDDATDLSLRAAQADDDVGEGVFVPLHVLPPFGSPAAACSAMAAQARGVTPGSGVQV
ncbi:redoxin domain-containing protein [Nonomuraea sp. G32]|nr:redoxin domain-containing protein [Nonomuraea sp. G32]MDP4510039.1 redoxin domain-containing protein [Nonomuraea sp. G32]